MADLETVHDTLDHTGLTGVGGAAGAGSILQIVTALSTANDTTTSTTYQASSLSLAITPQQSNSKLLIEVSGEFNAYRAAGTILERYGWVRIYNTTNSVQVHEEVRGRNLIATNAAVATGFLPIGLRGIYTVNSTAARTFRLEFKSGLATNTEVAIRGDRGAGAMMTIMEIKV